VKREGRKASSRRGLHVSHLFRVYDSAAVPIENRKGHSNQFLSTVAQRVSDSLYEFLKVYGSAFV
jgi:hypothetical protein